MARRRAHRRRGPAATVNNHEPRRDRKLLLHRVQIDQLLGKTKAKGLTLVPLRLYISDRGRAKIELGLARGKQLHDRRRDIADRDARRDMERQLAESTRRLTLRAGGRRPAALSALLDERLHLADEALAASRCRTAPAARRSPW